MRCERAVDRDKTQALDRALRKEQPIKGIASRRFRFGFRQHMASQDGQQIRKRIAAINSGSKPISTFKPSFPNRVT